MKTNYTRFLIGIVLPLFNYFSLNAQCVTPANPTPISSTVNIDCNDQATLEVSGSTGDYQWFSDPNGNNQIGTGSSYTTGPLTVDTTIYVAAVGSGSGTGDTYNFSNAGATGNLGPTQANVNNAYLGTPLENEVTVLGSGIQEWVVPTTGAYRIEAFGAQGGGANGGLGAQIEGEFNLTAGQVIHIVVGQEGLTFSNDRNISGGGGSYVVDANTNDIFVIAGGGGAGRNLNTNADGVITPDGQDGIDDGGVDGAGGTNGDGGEGASCRGGGGGGFLTNGQIACCGCVTNTAEGGYAFVNGSEGGGISATGIVGAFGGGGASEGVNNSWTYAGGGGGYSGGGGASSNGSNSHGGGGGSLNNGTNQTNNGGVNSGNGLVNIISLQPTCLSDIIPIDVVVDPLDDPSINGPNTFCSSGTFQLTATGSSGNYNWYSDPGATNLIHTGSTLNTGVISTTTSFYVEAANGPNCVSDLVEFEMIFDPGDTVVAMNDTTICEGSSVVITASGVDDYEWDNGLGVGQSFTVTPNSTTVYEVTGTDASSGCQSTDEVTVFVETAPTISFAVDDANCNGEESGEISTTISGNGPFNYSWNTGETSSDITGVGAGNYTVEVTDANGCSTTENVSVNEPTAIDIQTDITPSTCNSSDGSATANVNGGVGSYSYLWTPGGQTSQTVTNLAAGLYEVTVTDDNGCEETATANVQAFDAPQINLVSLNNVSCNGDEDGSISVNVTDGVPPYSLNWTPIGSGNSSINSLAPGTYTLEVTDDSGCTNQEVFEISEPNPISASSLSTPANCGLFDGEINISASGGTGNLSYNWTPSEVSGSNPTGLAAGDYSVTIMDENNCQVNLNETVDLVGSFSIEADPNFAEIQEGENVSITTTLSISDSAASYLWTPSTGLSCSNCNSTNASPGETTVYYVTATFPDGCTATDSVLIEFLPPCGEVFVPNMFSPNNDGNNDELCVYGDCLESMNFDIYNRWGEKVFSSNDLGNCWRGNFKGRAVNSGVYNYKLVGTLRDGSTIQKSGNITLVR